MLMMILLVERTSCLEVRQVLLPVSKSHVREKVAAEYALELRSHNRHL